MKKRKDIYIYLFKIMVSITILIILALLFVRLTQSLNAFECHGLRFLSFNEHIFDRIAYVPS